jgi:ribosomal protein L34
MLGLGHRDASLQNGGGLIPYGVQDKHSARFCKSESAAGLPPPGVTLHYGLAARADSFARRPWTRCPMHYPKRISKVKRARKQGFLARMSTARGRKLINRKRRHGFKRLNVATAK